MLVKRATQNPLIAPQDVKPSHPKLRVEGVFNCGVTAYQGEYLLLCRIAESGMSQSDDEILIPLVSNIDGENRIEFKQYIKSEHPDLNFSDSRKVSTFGTHPMIVNLTSLSHLRIARSKDGINFELDDQPMVELTEEESWGMEDPRVTKIDDTYYINYTSVNPTGAATSLISTKDFKEYTRHGVIFAPENKDVTIFPEKINDYYVCFNRPVPNAIGGPEMWIAKSPDLIHWGQQEHFYGLDLSDPTRWDNGRVGGGAVPIKTEHGWLKIYHAADKQDRYCLGAFLLDLNDPSKIIAKTNKPFMEPIAEYEINGFFGNVVFTCGALLEDGVVKIFYGAADDKICRADIELTTLLDFMDEV
ncbi:glycoside hydrolase family 130 protein [Fundicoccus sp. Sow4_H7]|uniref:glycoside hydrolase family 130 protein n=1 Tax=Fundicoccus sp. Sow4_H7 TaxID=3438784 RepID=UPI003F8DFEB7